METKFQTSFIPKKPLIATDNTAHRGPSSTSILMLIGVLAFVISLGGAGFTYFSKYYLLKNQEQYRHDLDENEKRFNTALIDDLRKANVKIDLAKKFLQNHIAASEALTIVGALTAEKVYFQDFEFTAPDINAISNNNNGAAPTTAPTYRIKMKGVADSFNSVGWQSKVFGKSKEVGTNKVLKNPILSDLTVDTNGDVKFNFTAEIAAEDVSYAKVLGATLQEEGTLPVPAPVQ